MPNVLTQADQKRLPWILKTLIENVMAEPPNTPIYLAHVQGTRKLERLRICQVPSPGLLVLGRIFRTDKSDKLYGEIAWHLMGYEHISQKVYALLEEAGVTNSFSRDLLAVTGNRFK